MPVNGFVKNLDVLGEEKMSEIIYQVHCSGSVADKDGCNLKSEIV